MEAQKNQKISVQVSKRALVTEKNTFKVNVMGNKNGNQDSNPTESVYISPFTNAIRNGKISV